MKIKKIFVEYMNEEELPHFDVNLAWLMILLMRLPMN